ncbi:uncharacterized protein LOC112346378 [Selaginella moellendorffii]|uniref:uncharacterized protein LOC112346378 n=1 Tax=Selaginella moellendorffii TaxID=88036 RepID=UPI000D1C3953|nr:uncharacterized protein LOC112346378 [Selaginella moellendorffii]|eukprot:XP_024531016.1 uncharacterized protein LOC112346378 [Selaginella moellendorffii]
MARTEQERCGCVTGLWSLFRPKKAHKGDNKVQAEAVSGEAMDAAALKLKELRRELKEEEQEKRAEQLNEEEQEKLNAEEKEADQTKELRREVKQEQGQKEQPQLEREEKSSRPKMVRFSSSAEDILPDGTRRRSETHLSDGRGGYVEFAYLEAFHKANRWLNQRGKTEKKIRSLEEEKYEETEEEDEEKSWSVSALRILIRLTEQLYEELNGKSSDRERIKRARKMMRLQKMLDRIPSERKPWKKLESGEVVFVKVAKELYDRAGRDFVAEFKRKQETHKARRPARMQLANSDQSALEAAEAGVHLAAKTIKGDYTLQCLEQGGFSFISFPVDGDETGAKCSQLEDCNEMSSLVDGDFENASGLSRNARTAARVKVSGKNSVSDCSARDSRRMLMASTSKKREMKLRAREVGCKDWSTRGQFSDSSIGEANSRESNPEVGAASQISKQVEKHRSRPETSREDQWIKLSHTLQCLEQGGIYLIGFPVDGDDSRAPAAVRLSMIVARNNRNQCQMAARWQEDDIAEAARDREFLKEKPQGIMADGVESAARGGALGEEHVEKRMAELGSAKASLEKQVTGS